MLKLGYRVSATTIRTLLGRRRVPPAPRGKTKHRMAALREGREAGQVPVKTPELWGAVR